jgi:hypothetical protein
VACVLLLLPLLLHGDCAAITIRCVSDVQRRCAAALSQVMLARDALRGAEGLFSVDLSPDAARSRFHVLAFESPDDAARLVWLLRALQAAPGAAGGSDAAGLRLGSDTQLSMAPMPPQVRAAA